LGEKTAKNHCRKGEKELDFDSQRVFTFEKKTKKHGQMNTKHAHHDSVRRVEKDYRNQPGEPSKQIPNMKIAGHATPQSTHQGGKPLKCPRAWPTAKRMAKDEESKKQRRGYLRLQQGVPLPKNSRPCKWAIGHGFRG